jgi:hypothetical protein
MGKAEWALLSPPCACCFFLVLRSTDHREPPNPVVSVSLNKNAAAKIWGAITLCGCHVLRDLGEGIARTAPTRPVLHENTQFDEPIDVAQRGIRRGFHNLRPFGRGELAVEIVEQTIEHRAPPFVQCGAGVPVPEAGFLKHARLFTARANLFTAYNAENTGANFRVRERVPAPPPSTGAALVPADRRVRVLAPSRPPNLTCQSRARGDARPQAAIPRCGSGLTGWIVRA